jgi:hypothetical protein
MKLSQLRQIIKEEISKTLNESSFTFTYNTDPDDLAYVKRMLSKAGVTASVKKGTFEDEVEVTVDKKDLNKAKKAIEKGGFELD